MSETSVPQFSSFEEFYPFYISQHSKRATRWVHVAGTTLGIAAGVRAFSRRKPAELIAWPVISYAFAWTAHFGIEKNKPASFGHPIWSLMGDFKMVADMATGKDAQLQAMADDYLASLELAQLAFDFELADEQAKAAAEAGPVVPAAA